MAGSKMQVSSSLMQNYREAAPFSHDTRIACTGGTDDTPVLFSIGSNGHLHVMTRNQGSETGWLTRDFSALWGIKGAVQHVCAATDRRGALHLVAAVETSDDPASDSLYYLKDFSNDPAISPWQYCGKRTTEKIQEVSIGFDTTGAPIVVFRTTSARYHADSVFWINEFNAEPVPHWVDVIPRAVGQSYRAFACAVADADGVTGAWVSYVYNNNERHNLEFIGLCESHTVRVAAQDFCSQIAVARGNDGKDQLFVGIHSSYYSYEPPVGLRIEGNFGGHIAKLAATPNADGTFDVFTLTSDYFLEHRICRPGETHNFIPSNRIIRKQVAHFAVCNSADQNSDLFCADFTNRLQWVTHDKRTGDWTPTPVAVAATGIVEEYRSYGSLLTFADENQSPLSFAEVRIASSALASFSINGEIYAVSSTEPVTCLTNAAGQIMVSRTANRLATPTLEISADFLSQPEKLEQNAGIQQQLKAITTQDQLRNARKADGSLLLKPQTAGLDQVIQGLQAAMSLTESGPEAGRIHLPAVRAQFWEFDTSTGSPVFRTHTAASFGGATAALGGVFDAASWGEVWSAVECGVTQITKIVVGVAKDAAGTIEVWLSDKFGTLWRGEVSLLEQAFDVVQGIFSSIQVFFSDLFDWLGFLFDWDDILRTKDAVVHCFGEFVPFIKTALTSVKPYVKEGINLGREFVKKQIPLVGSAVGQSWGAQKLSNMGSPAQHSQLAELSSTMLKNIFFTGFLSNLDQTKPPANDDPFPEPLSNALSRLEAIANEFVTSEGFKRAVKNFSDIAKSPDQVLNLSLSAIWNLAREAVDVALQLVDVVAELVIDSLAELLDYVWKQLTSPWNIPFLSDLYSHITNGKTLTILDLFALMLAVPATVLYKSALKAAPFATDAALAAFKQEFTTAGLLRESGIHRAPAALLDSGPGLAAQEGNKPAAKSAGQLILGFLYAVNAFVFGHISAVGDIIAPADAKKLKPRYSKIRAKASKDDLQILSIVTIVPEYLSQMLSIPWYAGDGGPLEPLNDKTAFGNWVWIYQWVGVGIDSFALSKTGTVMNFAGDAATGGDCIYGYLHLGLQFVWALLDDYKDPIPVSLNIIGTVPEAGKLLRLLEVVEASEGTSLAALVAVDLVCSKAVAALVLTDLLKKPAAATA